MLDKFNDYLSIFNFTKVRIERIESALTLNAKILQNEILDIFICEIKSAPDGNKTFTSLWLITDRYMIECKEFLTEVDFDITPYVKKIKYCSIQAQKFDFETLEEGSSVEIYFALKGDVKGMITATDENCTHAFNFYKQYVVPNIVD